MAVVKPAQTGEPRGAARDLAGWPRYPASTDLHELARFPDPLSPEAAARAAGVPPLDLRRADHVGGLAPAGTWCWSRARAACWSGTTRRDTLADLAALLAAPVLLVAEPGWAR